MNFLITGGAGFIGSAVIRHIINNTSYNITDDVQSIENKKNSKIKYLLGDKANLKITTISDISLFKSYINKNLRIGV